MLGKCFSIKRLGTINRQATARTNKQTITISMTIFPTIVIVYLFVCSCGGLPVDGAKSFGQKTLSQHVQFTLKRFA
jgi:hypothetical protein